MINIDAKYEVWKNKLLDMGKRNRLLNYKETARSTVMITSPNCEELYDFFVKNENELIFPYKREDDEEVEETVDLSNVTTNKNISDLQRTLRNLRNKAKTAVEEQGVNVLYLTFGFLKWTEADHSKQEISSPLILVPAELAIESITSPYKLKLHEDEIVLNPTLVYKMENDFGITLPPFDEAESINDYLTAVQKVVAPNKWTVSNAAGLSLLSFLKINMYSDLSKHRDAIVSNPIIRAISGDVSAIERIPDGLNDYDFDKKETPNDVYQVVDADASQQDAILMAKNGVSFVLQGPPGTGKSQTITNIIAESLADGKKVLFVSEKMAALDVVHRRLASAGLDDFCLVLHSHKANKRSVLDQLQKVLDLSLKKVSLSDEAYQKLDILQADKTKLNDYADQVYAVVEPLGKSIYEANGIVANLESYDDIIFSVENVRETSKEQYNRYCYLLTQYASTIGKMTNDYKSNPWFGCKLNTVSNEFRHDAMAKLSTLLPKVKGFDEKLGTVFKELYLDTPHTLKDVEKIVDVLQVMRRACAIPEEWIFTNVTDGLFNEFEQCRKIKEKVIEHTNYLKSIYEKIIKNETRFSEPDYKKLISSLALSGEKERIFDFIYSNEPYKTWSVLDIKQIEEFLPKAEDVAKAIHDLQSEILYVYEPSVFEIDHRAVLKRIKTEYTSFTKIFKKEYKQDKKDILFHRREIGKKISDEDMLWLVEKLCKLEDTRKWFDDNRSTLTAYFGEEPISENTDFAFIAKRIEAYKAIGEIKTTIDELQELFVQIEESEHLWRNHYKFLYNGIFSDWEAIKSALSWAIFFKDIIKDINVTDSFIKRVCQADEFIQVCLEAKETLESYNRDLRNEYNWFVKNFNQPELFDGMELCDLYTRLQSCMNGFSLLEEWIDFSAARDKCTENGLNDCISAIANYDIPANSILPVFKKRFFRLWLDAVLPEHPAVMNFRRKIQEDTIHEFASLDKVQFEIAKARIQSRLINSLPSLEHFTSGVDEISILKRELSKQRKIMPIRKLFKTIPNLLLTLKPCLMMSPLSVSLFLEAETYKFDIVIFDEASQVCTENAIGAISRAKQVVIAGDSKQLPPTNFFQAAMTENEYDVDDDDEYDDLDAYESILDEANMLPERTLRWHYRSRHESLIAFSNAKIYKNNLITFPSNIEKVANNGVEYIYVPDGYYDRGGRKGNVIEANKIADLVFKHFDETPHRSLGIIAFGEVQQQAIETVIRERRLRNQKYETFFAEDKEEAFFVKNLENVQGDERDTIIFSIGYAKDNAGVFRMNFGPLSKSGGERRLNVAITRAKYNVKLVGSIMPTDIDTNKISSEGPKLLRTYIDFAINGPEVLDREITESDIVEHDSPFEEAVYNFLDRKGYKLGTQVGCSGYRIDMAVKHPTLSGIYVLGVECDGAAYHSARTARERDRLRQDVLENMGWKIYRIWSTDWIKDPVAEGEKLLAAVEEAIETFGVDGFDTTISSSPEDMVNAEDFVNVEVKTTSKLNASNPYGFEKTSTADFSSLPRDRFGYLNATDCVMEIINAEYPVHYDLICQRMAPLFGNEKATVKVRREVDFSLNRLNHKIIQKNDFYFPKGYEKIPVRIPNSRKIQHISIDELSEAIYQVLITCVGTTREGICAETTRVYGFARSGPKITQAMMEALDDLISANKVVEVEGKLQIISR